MTRTRPADLVVVGAGPAARAVVRAAHQHDLTTTMIAPDAERPWAATYGAWLEELPADLPSEVLATTADPAVAIGPSGIRHHLRRPYVVLDTGVLQAHLSAVDPSTVVTGIARGVRREGGLTGVVLGDGAVSWGRVVIDASGAVRALSGGRPAPPRAAQTAVGVIVAAHPQIELAFMDWRTDHGEEGWPTFLYAVGLGGGRVLLEETSLARRPGLPLAVLRRRLHRRLASRGIDVPADAPEERVWFTVDTPRSTGVGAVVPFGASAPLIHPATGYSVAAGLRLAPRLVAAVAGALPDGRAAARAARRVLWPPGARLVHHLRRRGLEVLLALPSQDAGPFFDRFFSLPPEAQRAYLSERSHPWPVLRAMAGLFGDADPRMQRSLLRWGALPVGDAPSPRGADGTMVGHD